MRTRTSWAMCFVFMGLVAGLTLPLAAQAPTAEKEKPPIYFYIAEWGVPRAQWGDMTKLEDQDKALLDKLVADGTITGYGAYSELIHQENGPTHGTWFSARTEGGLLKALEQFYAQPALVGSAVQGASKHWDYILTGRIYNAKPGSSAGYLSVSRWKVNPGEMRGYTELTKSTMVPVLEKLLAEGTISGYGLVTEDYHTTDPGVIFEYFMTPDAASLDKANAAFEEVFAKNAALGGASRTMLNREGHRDSLSRIRFMVNK
jgi:hypothetical protein